MIHIYIPVRRNSSRLPEKFTAQIGDKPLLAHVYEACQATGFGATVLCDDVDHFLRHMPGANIAEVKQADSGTERIANYLWPLGSTTFPFLTSPEEIFNDNEIIINVQGDLPFIRPEQILQVVAGLDYGDVSTLITKMTGERLADKNTVKAVCTPFNGHFYRAHWFQRAELLYGFHHIGVYAFRAKTLHTWHTHKNSKYADFEKLEQLRWLENGSTIAAVYTGDVVTEVNTPEDLQKAREYYEIRKSMGSDRTD